MSTPQLVVTAVVLQRRNNHGQALPRIAWLLRAIFPSGTSRRSVTEQPHLKAGRHRAEAPDPQ
jgi:hypothetical protein